MNEKKVCFIICTNNDILLKECLTYISYLYVPDGIEVDILTIVDAESMTMGYNEGMRSTDAKYKVYLHQDVFIINRWFIFDLLNVFSSDINIGMMGIVGYKEMSPHGIMWLEEKHGEWPLYGVSESYKNADFSAYRYSIEDGIVDVAVVDGLLIATAFDVEWDESFDMWDFYDASQSFQMKRAGKRVIVPVQNVPWVIHDDGTYLNVSNYNKYRHMFLEKYYYVNDKDDSE